MKARAHASSDEQRRPAAYQNRHHGFGDASAR